MKQRYYKQHKWHKEIKAWADGKTIEFRFKDTDNDWEVLDFECPNWYYEPFEYRIKPQPKEPQYLYASYHPQNSSIRLLDYEDKNNYYIGKIKLEVDE